MKKLLLILFLFISSFSYGQVFSQTFVDRCTNEITVVTANFASGSATVAFYSRIRTFTYQEFLSGQMNAWLQETYIWWTTLSPCSTVVQQTQQAQQQAQQAQQQAQQAASAATQATASIPVVPPTTPPVTPPPTTTAPTTGGTTNATTTQNTSTDSSSNTGSSSSSSTEGNTTGDTGGSTEGGTSDSKTNDGGSSTEESKTEETKTEETKSEEKTEEVKEEKKEEAKEEKKEEEKTEEKEESKEEEKKEEKSEEEKEKEEKEKKEKEKEEKKKARKEKNKLMPLQLKADAMANQNPLGGFNAVMNFGASQTSVFGDVSYSANMMLWDNLQQVSIMGARSKVKLSDDYQVKGINAVSIGYSNNYSISTLMASVSKMKPFKNGITMGVGVSIGSTFESYPIQENFMVSYNVLATKSFEISPQITYSPVVIWTQTPFMSEPNAIQTGWEHPFGIQAKNSLKGSRIDGTMILANSFTVKLTRRFSFNVGWTAIKSTNTQVPLINSFMIGSKLPF